MKFLIALLCLLPTFVQAHPGHAHAEGGVHKVGHLTADDGFMQLISNVGSYINNVFDSLVYLITTTTFIVPMTVCLLLCVAGLIAVARRSAKQRID